MSISQQIQMICHLHGVKGHTSIHLEASWVTRPCQFSAGTSRFCSWIYCFRSGNSSKNFLIRALPACFDFPWGLGSIFVMLGWWAIAQRYTHGLLAEGSGYTCRHFQIKLVESSVGNHTEPLPVSLDQGSTTFQRCHTKHVTMLFHVPTWF